MTRFTQYRRRDGRTRTIEIARPVDIETMALILRRNGCCFDAEVLTTGEVSFSIERSGGDLLAIEIVENGPGIPEAVDRLIRMAAEASPEYPPLK